MFPLSLILVSAFAGIFAVIYFIIVYNKNYWKKKSIPSPPTNGIFDNHRDLVNRFDYPGNYVFRDWTKKYGNVYGILEGWRKTWIIADPQMANEMFVKKFEFFHGRKRNPIFGNVDTMKRAHVFAVRGSRWKRLRMISNPSFNIANLKKILPTVDDSCQKLMTFFDKAFENGKPFNIHPYFHELTMDIICRIAMGQRESKLFQNPYVEKTKNVFLFFGGSALESWASRFPIFAPILRMFFLARNYFGKGPVHVMLKELEQNVNERKNLRASGKIDPNPNFVDFIDLFLDAEDPTVTDGTFDTHGMKVTKKMTEDEVIANCFVFLLAGFDTTANTLAVTTFLLAKHPKIQELLIEEIDGIQDVDSPTYEQINELRYLDAVMKEALRMFPIACFAASRECMRTTTLGEYKIQAGENVNIDVLTLHYNKDIWGENADEFMPERFFDFTSEQQLAYYPFGGGPRTCIGMRLAYLEEKLALVHLLRKYKIQNTPETEPKLKMIGRSVHNPESVTIKLVKR